VTGALARQRATLEEVNRAAADAGVSFPEAEVIPAWNEFDLDGIFRQFVPRLSAEDPAFRSQWREVEVQAREAGAGVHRQWLPCDSAVVLAWLNARFPFDGESWPAFQRRVRRAIEELVASDGAGDVAVFTSATPVGLALSNILGFDPRLALRLAGASFNTGMTQLWVDHRDPCLVTFNAVPHLDDPALRTLR